MKRLKVNPLRYRNAYLTSKAIERLAHSLLNQSEGLLALERSEEAALTRRKGFELFRQMARHKDAAGSAVYFRKLLKTARLLHRIEPVEADGLLAEAYELCRMKLLQEPENEAFLREVRNGIANGTDVEQTGFSTNAVLDRIKSLLPSSGTP